MPITVKSSLDLALAELIKNNYSKIKTISPKNPPISKDDEWRKEEEWDKMFEELEK